MKVTIEDVSTVKKTLHIEVPENDVTDALDSAYQDLKRNAKIKGFRPGKTPRSVLEQFYKKDVHADVAARLIQDSFSTRLSGTSNSVFFRRAVKIFSFTSCSARLS